MKTKEIRNKEDAYLVHELKDKMRHLFDLRTQAITEKLEDPSQINKTRRDIARIKTVLRERNLKIARHDDAPVTTTLPVASAAEAATPGAAPTQA
jgi:large subunit ribosomal protein L29